MNQYPVNNSHLFVKWNGKTYRITTEGNSVEIAPHRDEFGLDHHVSILSKPLWDHGVWDLLDLLRIVEEYANSFEGISERDAAQRGS
jgi:hypothetical protein